MATPPKRYLLDRAPLSLLVMVLDALIVVGAGELAYLLRFHSAVVLERYWWAITTMTLLILLINSTLDSYKRWSARGISNLLWGLVVAWGVVTLASTTIIYFFHLAYHFSRIWVVLALLLSFLGAVIVRVTAKFVLSRYRLRGRHRRPVFLVGPGEILRDVSRMMRQHQREGFSIKGIQRTGDVLSSAVREDIARRVTASHCSEVWICMPLSMGSEVQLLMKALRFLSIDVRFFPEFSDLPLLNHNIGTVVGMHSINLSVTPMTGMSRVLKRLEDLVFSSIILVMISPVLVVLAIGVKLGSPGPVFYRQERVSNDGRPFQMLKFRSMAVDSEKDGVQWGGANNKSVTRFGSFIRRTSLDELPQFLNVLLGDMSIVGPRPERTVFVEKFQYEIPRYMQKHMVKAGITGWAQIHGLRGDTSLDKRIEYDLWYIDHWSLWLDMKIILLTAAKVLFDKQAL